VGANCEVFHDDVMKLANDIKPIDVVYMDPPYPSTMNNYDAFYGLFDEMFSKK
jgi:adenine-specific DNA-methyltransferase